VVGLIRLFGFQPFPCVSSDEIFQSFVHKIDFPEHCDGKG